MFRRSLIYAGLAFLAWRASMVWGAEEPAANKQPQPQAQPQGAFANANLLAALAGEGTAQDHKPVDRDKDEWMASVEAQIGADRSHVRRALAILLYMDYKRNAFGGNFEERARDMWELAQTAPYGHPLRGKKFDPALVFWETYYAPYLRCLEFSEHNPGVSYPPRFRLDGQTIMDVLGLSSSAVGLRGATGVVSGVASGIGLLISGYSLADRYLKQEHNYWSMKWDCTLLDARLRDRETGFGNRAEILHPELTPRGLLDDLYAASQANPHFRKLLKDHVLKYSPRLPLRANTCLSAFAAIGDGKNRDVPIHNIVTAKKKDAIGAWRQIYRASMWQAIDRAKLKRRQTSASVAAQGRNNLAQADRHQPEAWEQAQRARADILAATNVVASFLSLGSDEERKAAIAISHFGHTADRIIDLSARWEAGLLSSFTFSANLYLTAFNLVMNLFSLMGPSPEELILDEVRELRRELREFHQIEMDAIRDFRAENCELHAKVLEAIDQVNERLDVVLLLLGESAHNLSSQTQQVFFELKAARESVREDERFKTYVDNVVSPYDDWGTKKEDADKLSRIYTFLHAHAVGRVLAGGDTELGTDEGLRKYANEALDSAQAAAFAVWHDPCCYVNDYLRLAGVQNFKAANIHYWGLGATRYREMFETTFHGKPVPDVQRLRLAEIYGIGEATRQALFKLSDWDCVAPKYSGIFCRELQTLKEFEDALIRQAGQWRNVNWLNEVAAWECTEGDAFGSRNPAHPDAWLLPESLTIPLSNTDPGHGMARDVGAWLERNKLRDDAVVQLALGRDEVKRLEEMIPPVYRHARRLGFGEIKLEVADAGFEKPSVYRWKWVLHPAGHQGWWRRDPDARIESRVWLELWCYFNPRWSAEPLTIFRKRFYAAPQECATVKVDRGEVLREASEERLKRGLEGGEPVYELVDVKGNGNLYELTFKRATQIAAQRSFSPVQSQDLQAQQAVVASPGPPKAWPRYWVVSDRAETTYDPGAFARAVSNSWGCITRSLLAPGGRNDANCKEDPEVGRKWEPIVQQSQKMLTQRLNVMQARERQKWLLRRLQERQVPGSAYSKLIGYDRLLANYVWLALPGFCTDRTDVAEEYGTIRDRLRNALVVTSPFRATEFNAAVFAKGGNGVFPLLTQENGTWVSPYCREVRRRIVEAESALAEALAYARMHPEVREHPSLRLILEQIALTAKRHNIDLQAEIKKLDRTEFLRVVPPEDRSWVCLEIDALLKLAGWAAQAP